MWQTPLSVPVVVIDSRHSELRRAAWPRRAQQSGRDCRRVGITGPPSQPTAGAVASSSCFTVVQVAKLDPPPKQLLGTSLVTPSWVHRLLWRPRFAMTQLRPRTCRCLTAAVGATRRPPPRPDRAAAVGPRLLIRQSVAPLISQLTPISEGRSTIRHLRTRLVAVAALPHCNYTHTHTHTQVPDTAARVHPTSQAVNALNRPTVDSWWFDDTVAARLVVSFAGPME